HLQRPHADLVAVFENALVGDALVIQVRSIGAAEIVNVKTIGPDQNRPVVHADLAAIHLKVAVAMAANQEFSSIHLDKFTGVLSRRDEQLAFHGSPPTLLFIASNVSRPRTDSKQKVPRRSLIETPSLARYTGLR